MVLRESAEYLVDTAVTDLAFVPLGSDHLVMVGVSGHQHGEAVRESPYQKGVYFVKDQEWRVRDFSIHTCNQRNKPEFTHCRCEPSPAYISSHTRLQHCTKLSCRSVQPESGRELSLLSCPRQIHGCCYVEELKGNNTDGCFGLC